MTVFTDPAIWHTAKLRYPIGSKISGVVILVAQFGVFLDLGGEVIALLRVTEMAGDNPKQLSDYPEAGQTVNARVLWFDDRNRQVTLSQRESAIGNDQQ